MSSYFSDPMTFLKLPPFSPLYLLTYTLLGGLFFILRLVYWRPWTSPLGKLRGPEGGNGGAGHYVVLLDPEQAPHCFKTWTDAYGQTFNTKGPFGLWDRLWTTDPLALHHVLRHTTLYPKPPMLRATLGRYLKEGLINAEGDRHRIVRRIVGGLFGKGNVRGMMPVFTMKCGQLRGMWSERVNTLISDFHSQTILSSPEAIRQEETETGVLMDVLDGLNRLSFDIIGLTAFDHSFDALRGMKGKGFVVPWPGSEGEEKQHPAAATREQVKPAQSIEEDHGEGSRIYEAYDRMFDVCEGRTGLRGMLSVMWPALDKIWPTENSRRVAEGMGNIDNLTERLVKAKKMELLEAEKQGLGGLDHGGKRGKDLLTLIVKADMAMKPEERMTDLEISGALATFMFAGTDTGSIVMSWCLYHLAGSPSVQSRLREECAQYGENISLDDLDTLPLLDMVVKEVYRLNPSIPTTIRMAMQDDIIPLQEAIALKSGQVVSEVKIRKGQYVYIPIEGLNWSHQFWGPDALEFKGVMLSKLYCRHQAYGEISHFPFRPDRWETSKILASTGLGIDQHVLTFIDGPRKCLGYQMGTLEVKSTLFALVQQFEFARPPGMKMYKWNMFTNRPHAWDRRFPEGSNMPLVLRPHRD